MRKIIEVCTVEGTNITLREWDRIEVIDLLDVDFADGIAAYKGNIMTFFPMDRITRIRFEVTDDVVQDLQQEGSGKNRSKDPENGDSNPTLP